MEKIREAMDSHEPSLDTPSLQFQMSKFIIEPLRNTASEVSGSGASPGWPDIIIIDGLNECGDEETQQDVFATLQQLLASDLPFRLLITARTVTNDDDDNGIFGSLSEATQANLIQKIDTEARAYSAASDVKGYLQRSFGKIRDEYKIESEWPQKSTLEQLIGDCHSSFLHASFAVAFVRCQATGSQSSHDASTRLRTFLTQGTTTFNDKGPLDGFYRKRLRGNRFKVLAIRIIALFPTSVLAKGLSPKQLQRILRLEDTEIHSLEELQPLLHIPAEGSGSEYRIHHKDLVDFLSDPSRAEDLWLSDAEVYDAIHTGYDKMCTDITRHLSGATSNANLSAHEVREILSLAFQLVFTSQSLSHPGAKSSPSPKGTALKDVILLSGAIILLSWPWAFFGAAFDWQGLQGTNSFAATAVKHPQATNALVTLIATFISLAHATLYSRAATRFYQEWIAGKSRISLFHITTAGALTQLRLDLSSLHNLRRGRGLPIVTLLFLVGCSMFLIAGLSSLLLPVLFEQTTALVGREIDLFPADPECDAWFGRVADRISQTCGSRVHTNGVTYATCLGQIPFANVLAAGRLNALSNLTTSHGEGVSVSNLGANKETRVHNPFWGILPIDPASAPSSTLQVLRDRSSFNPATLHQTLPPYSYTLNYQGVSTIIGCAYDIESPITLDPAVEEYAGICAEGTDIIQPGEAQLFPLRNSSNSIAYWACKTSANVAATSPSPYNIYLRGFNLYEGLVGNLTCSLTVAQPVIFPLTYHSDTQSFSSTGQVEHLATPNTGQVSRVIERVLVAISGVIHDSQGMQLNLMAESVITTGSLFQLPRGQDPGYLPLYERALRGIFDYEISYLRLILSTEQDVPSSCFRHLTGAVTYQAFGWSVTNHHIGFLFPITLFNLTAVIFIILAIKMAKDGSSSHLLDPTNPRVLLHANLDSGDDEWERTVTFDRSLAMRLASERTMELLVGGDLVGDL
ncbi:hypothetical protein FA15DRAFT_627443 [Coprinopsis marcescibilis]|uniref:NACHT domain-containing protein n=1 Tax=Coprinopsis marcescibilis TaxID=230819 RepID=A0A5C3KFQ7_COPMA|nr:hypothetical protein FA15DRAFT_627443 [Coprinopsis marcescibilis]